MSPSFPEASGYNDELSAVGKIMELLISEQLHVCLYVPSVNEDPRCHIAKNSPCDACSYYCCTYPPHFSVQQNGTSVRGLTMLGKATLPKIA
jgi:hypothetical protein